MVSPVVKKLIERLEYPNDQAEKNESNCQRHSHLQSGSFSFRFVSLRGEQWEKTCGPTQH
jgi:hypothetical protein